MVNVILDNPIPSELYQTTIELRLGTTKLLKVHVYYTTSKILVQGKACIQWVDREFEKLRTIVHTLATCASPDPDSLALMDLRTPDPSIAVCILKSEQLCNTTEDEAIALPNPDNTSSTHSREESGDQACQSDPCLSPSPPPSSTPESTSALSHPPPTTPILAQELRNEISPLPSDITQHRISATERDNSPSSIPSDVEDSTSPSSSPNTKALPTTQEPPCISDSTFSFTPSPTDVQDSAIQKDIAVSDSTSSFTPSPTDVQDSAIQKDIAVSDSTSSFTPSPTDLHDSAMQKDIAVSDNTYDNPDNTDNASVAENDDSKETISTCSHNDCVSRVEFDTVVQSMQAEISALRSALTEARQSFKIEFDDLRTHFRHFQNSSTKSPEENSTSHNKKNKSTSSQSSLASSKSRKKINHPPTQNYPSQTPTVFQTSTSQPPSLSILQVPVVADNDVDVTANEAVTNSDARKSTFPHPLQDVSVSKETAVILLGDSVIKGIDLCRSTPPHSTPQKVCVSGLTVNDITEWLSHQSPSHGMKRAVIHVGINDCKQPPVSAAEQGIPTEKWRQLFSQCRRVFPKASLQASSILPARGRNPLNAAIRPSNNNLRLVCDSMGVRYTDHTSIFVTVNGAPRMALYKDAIHPTNKGTARLAENLFPPPNTNHSPGVQNKVLTRKTTNSSPPTLSPVDVNCRQSPPTSRPSSDYYPSSGQVTQKYSRQHHSQQSFHHLHSSTSPSEQPSSESFPPLPRSIHRRPPPPDPLPTPAQQTMRGSDSYPWLFPPQSMAPPVPPPFFYPPFPQRGPPPPWHWPYYMSVPPSYMSVPPSYSQP